MKNCPNCNTQCDDQVQFCPGCGCSFVQAPPPAYAAPAPVVDPFDHTAEFDAKDISDNKVISMLVYLMGAIGIVIALLASSNSAYAGFHVRQALKITVVEILAPIAVAVCAIINIIPFLGWFVFALVMIAYGALSVALLVAKIIAFFQICKGKAVEPIIIRNLTFLK